MPGLRMQSMQDLRQGDQERGMRRLQQAIRKMHVRQEIGGSSLGFNIRKIGTVLSAIEVGNAIPGRWVVAVLERQAKTRGLPRIVRTGKGRSLSPGR